MIKAVIFDMDGLLIDSEPFWRKAHMSVLAEGGFVITEDDVRHMAGKRTSHVVEEWRNRFGWDITENPAIEERIVAQVFKEVHKSGKALPGVKSLVNELKAQSVPMAVASSSAPELIETVLEKLKLNEKIPIVHSGVREKRSKPFPDIFLSTAAMLGVEPRDCVVFEDSLNGVKAAKAADMRCIAVPESPYDVKAFTAANPDKIIASLEDVHWADLQSL